MIRSLLVVVVMLNTLSFIPMNMPGIPSTPSVLVLTHNSVHRVLDPLPEEKVQWFRPCYRSNLAEPNGRPHCPLFTFVQPGNDSRCRVPNIIGIQLVGRGTIDIPIKLGWKHFVCICTQRPRTLDKSIDQFIRVFHVTLDVYDCLIREPSFLKSTAVIELT